MGRKFIHLSLIAIAITGVIGGTVLATSLNPIAKLELDNRKIQTQFDELRDLQPWNLCVTGGVTRPPKKIQPQSAYEECETKIREKRTKKIEMTLSKIDKQRKEIAAIKTESLNSTNQLLMSLMVQRASGARYFMLGERRVNDAFTCALQSSECGEIPDPTVDQERHRAYKDTHANGSTKARIEYESADTLIQNAFCEISNLRKLRCIEPEFRNYNMLYNILMDTDDSLKTPTGTVN